MYRLVNDTVWALVVKSIDCHYSRYVSEILLALAVKREWTNIVILFRIEQATPAGSDVVIFFLCLQYSIIYVCIQYKKKHYSRALINY